jgi:hypothetical protein
MDRVTIGGVNLNQSVGLIVTYRFACGPRDAYLTLRALELVTVP